MLMLKAWSVLDAVRLNLSINSRLIVLLYGAAAPVGAGKIKLRWVADKDARIYVIEQLMSTGPIPAGEWEVIGKTRNVSFTVTGLNPGQLYTFRVYGSNGNADGNPSDPAEQRSL